MAFLTGIISSEMNISFGIVKFMYQLRRNRKRGSREKGEEEGGGVSLGVGNVTTSYNPLWFMNIICSQRVYRS